MTRQARAHVLAGHRAPQTTEGRVEGSTPAAVNAVTPRPSVTTALHESRARRLAAAEATATLADERIRELTDKLADAEARAMNAEDRARDADIVGILPDRLYTVGTEIPIGDDGVLAVVDISDGYVYLRHEHAPDLWRKLEPGANMWSSTATMLGEGGPFLPIGQDAAGLVTCAARYDAVDRALRELARVVEQPESPWRREIDHRNVIEWATQRIRHADEAVRRSAEEVRVLTDSVDCWRNRAHDAEADLLTFTEGGAS